MRKYNYLYSEDGVLTKIEEAEKGGFYYLIPNDKESKFSIKEGKVNIKHFFQLSGESTGGESPEHWNAKMKIVHEKKYYDTIFKQFIYFDYCIPEIKQCNKIPDISCFIDGVLVMAIEIHYTNPKTTDDVESLKNLNIPITEIDIKNENRCKHLILPSILEANKSEYTEIEANIRKIESFSDEKVNEYVSTRTKPTRDRVNEYKDRVIFNRNKHRESIREIERVIENRQPELKSAITEIEYNEEHYQRCLRIGERISEIRTKTEEVDRIELGIKSMEVSFKEVAVNCKIEWFRNKWMTGSSRNLIEEIKYWVS
jgi:hypothetical protein